MAAKNVNFSNSLLRLIFNGDSIVGIANNATQTYLYVSLYTSSPTSVGNQSSNEATYPGYARVAVLRTSSGWIVNGRSVSPTADIVFPVAAGGNETETYFGIGTSATGGGSLLYFGAISPPIVVSATIAPTLDENTTITES